MIKTVTIALIELIVKMMYNSKIKEKVLPIGFKEKCLLSKYILLLLSLGCTSVFALTLSVNVGKEKNQSYSTIHIKEDLSFPCTYKKNDMDEIRLVECTFPREPKEKFEKIETEFFIIDSFNKNKKYHISILPLKKIKLIPISHKLYEKGLIRSPQTYKSSKHWMLIAYSEKLPHITIEETPSIGLNFPIAMEEVMLPSVGALDISGMPIRLDQVKDVSDFMRIKAAYEAGNYNQLANDVDALFLRFPDTIFKAELLLFKMRGLHKSDESEALLEVSKEFIREYSDDENMAEVLAYTANAYSAVGLQVDGTYFYERLFKEFEKSKFAALGMIFLGDEFHSSGKAKQAVQYFEKALYATEDIEVASMAAIRLAKISLEQGDVQRSAELYNKIVEGNAKFLQYNVEKNYDNARALTNRGEPKAGANLLTGIIKHLSASDDRYEPIMKDIGVWLAKTDDKASAYMALKAYQKKYVDGEYSSEVQETLDALFYTPEDANKTALLAEYESLQEKYSNEEIGQKAAFEKAKILFSDKEYRALINMEGTGVEKEVGYFELKHKAALALALQSLENGKCSQAIALSQEYNLSIESKHDRNLYTCAFQTGNYTLAKNISMKHLKDKEERLQWLFNYAKTLHKLAEYNELVRVAEDVIVLSDLDKTDSYNSILKDAFYAYEYLNQTQEMIKTVKELEKRRGLNNQDIEVYVSMIKLGLKQKDDVIIETYAGKVMSLQDKTKSYSQSPFVEFTALQVLKTQNKQAEQVAILTELTQRELKDKDRSRVYYMLGSLLMKEGKIEEAKNAFDRSVKADETSAWSGLSKDALNLL